MTNSSVKKEKVSWMSSGNFFQALENIIKFHQIYVWIQANLFTIVCTIRKTTFAM